MKQFEDTKGKSQRSRSKTSKKKKLEANLVVSGVPYVHGEDQTKIVNINIALNANVQAQDIVKIKMTHQNKSKFPDKAQPPILIKFKEITTKREFLEKRKAARALRTSKIGFTQG